MVGGAHDSLNNSDLGQCRIDFVCSFLLLSFTSS